jgi:methylated-DNA-[protein]-cysteine S-methyltransferase
MPMLLYQSEVGTIGIVERDGCIKRVYITDAMPEEEVYETPLLKEAARQLEGYFAGELKEFTLPLSPEGTEFMKRVWAALCDIPYGKTASYKDIAEKIGAPKAARAVGLANNRNPIPVIIPCHRVIGADGSLTGYAGGLDMKQKLLDLEKRL